MTRQRMAANGRAGVTSTGAEGGKREGLERPPYTPQNTRPMQEHDRPSRRRCPSCRIQLPSGEFVPIDRAEVHGGFAWRRCPRCQHAGPLITFSRMDAGAQRQAVRR